MIMRRASRDKLGFDLLWDVLSQPANDYLHLPSTQLSRADSNRLKYYAYSVPGFGDFLKTVARSGELSSYMDRYGLTWDTVDPLHANDRFGSNPISAGASAVRLSKNLMRLYR